MEMEGDADDDDDDDGGTFDFEKAEMSVTDPLVGRSSSFVVLDPQQTREIRPIKTGQTVSQVHCSVIPLRPRRVGRMVESENRENSCRAASEEGEHAELRAAGH